MPICWLCGELFEPGADHKCLDEPTPDEPVPDGMLKEMQDRLAAAMHQEQRTVAAASPKRKPKKGTD